MKMLLSYRKLLQRGLLKDSRLCFQRNLRGALRKIPNKEVLNEKVAPIIKEYEKKVDLTSLSATARLALKSNPHLLKEFNSNITINGDGEFMIKSYKMTSSANETVEKFESTNYVGNTSLPEKNVLKSLETTEDPLVPRSSIACGGCGSKLHCQNKDIEGFIPAKEFKESTKKELAYKLCLRCYFLKTNKKIHNLESDFDYDKFLVETLCAPGNTKKIHVVLLIDILDLPNSIYSGWSKLMDAKNVDIAIVGNKLDLLPDTGPGFMKGVMQCLAENFAKKNILGDQIKHVELISAKNGYNIEALISKLFEVWNDDGDVYLLGTTNAGKSVLYNRLLASDYCRTIASTAISRASTSFWPCTTMNTLKFPINFLNDKKMKQRAERLHKDQATLERIDEERYSNYMKHHNLRDAELLGMVGTTFNSQVSQQNEMNTELDATYSFNQDCGGIDVGENYEHNSKFGRKVIEDARDIYRPEYFKNKAAFFYDTPGVVDTHAIQRYFSKQELQIITPAGIIMPRTYWMEPGQTIFVSGLMRIDLLETTNNERALFTIMASPAMPIINPFKTEQADEKYNEYYEMGTKLRVPHRQHDREKPLPEMVGKKFSIECVGNHKSMTDIVFSSFGWAAVNSLPGVTVRLKAYTLGGIGLKLREPSLLPYVVNMRGKWFRKDDSQAFKSKYYTKPKVY